MSVNESTNIVDLNQNLIFGSKSKAINHQRVAIVSQTDFTRMPSNDDKSETKTSFTTEDPHF